MLALTFFHSILWHSMLAILFVVFVAWVAALSAHGGND